MLCRDTARGRHSRRLACLRSHVLRAYCNKHFESKQANSITLFGRRPNNQLLLLKRPITSQRGVVGWLNLMHRDFFSCTFAAFSLLGEVFSFRCVCGIFFLNHLTLLPKVNWCRRLIELSRDLKIFFGGLELVSSNLITEASFLALAKSMYYT